MGGRTVAEISLPEECWCNKTQSDHKLLIIFLSIQAPVMTVLHSDPIDLVILSL